MTGKNVPRLQRLGWGRMWIARGRNIHTYPGEPWGFDNGAYRDWIEGVPFDEGAYRDRLARARDVGTPYLAVLPDVVAGGHKSLELSLRWLEREAAWPWYLAVQDGIGPEDIDAFRGRIDGIFLGGSSAYKATARTWSTWSHERGLRFHYARVGTLRKLAHAVEVGANSVDSAFPLWTMERWQLFEDTWKNGYSQLSLGLPTA